MEVVSNQLHAARSTSLLDLACQTLDITNESNHLSIRSKYISIKMIVQNISGHLLQGNFATDRVSTPNNEADFINISAFLPQQNTCMVKQERLKGMISKTKNSMDVLDAHKSKAKTSIAQIGSMSSVINFTSLSINMDSIITAITTTDSLPPILRQFLLNCIQITNNTE